MFFNLINSIVPRLPPTKKNGTDLLFINYSFEYIIYCFPWVFHRNYIIYYFTLSIVFHRLPCNSEGKDSACNTGDPGSVPGLGRSTGEGISYPLQYSGASLVAHLVNNLPAMRETWVQSLSWEDTLEKGTATHSCIMAWRIQMDCIVHGVTKSWIRLSYFHIMLFSTNVRICGVTLKRSTKLLMG